LTAAVFYFGYKIEEQQVVRMQHEIDGRKMVEPVRA